MCFSRYWPFGKQKVGQCDLILLQIFFILTILKTKVQIICNTKFQPNTPSRSGEKVDFLGFAIFSIDGHLRFSTRLNFLLLKPYSLIMPYVKVENHGCSGLENKSFEWT